MSDRLKELPEDERPRERLLNHGPTALADAEVLAILLRTGAGGISALTLARGLLADGWPHLAGLTVPELKRYHGMGPTKAATVVAALEVGRRLNRARALDTITGPMDVIRLVDDMRALQQEEFRVIFLNTKHRVLAVETVFQGGLDSVEVYPREIFRRAVARSAAAIIVVHNHPSGDCSPSQADRQLTERLEAAGDLLGIPVLDHVVLGYRHHASIHQQQIAEFS
jgi:DNA repair protein RadC